MPVLSAREIYRVARMAGFSPDQAATMTAIALAESGGNTAAHNPNGENSKGLWQINVAAHRDLAGTNLYDPLENANAAYRVSRGGADMSPWTTTHGGARAKYLSYRMEAEAAARSAGDGSGLGVWSGTSGYGNRLAAGAAGSPVDASMYTPSTYPGSGSSGTAADDFVRYALAQTGDRYVFGAEADLADPDPTTFDCSELTQWAARRAGVNLPDGSHVQFQELQRQGGEISVEQALRTRGALLFRFSEPPVGSGRPAQAHVAISLGDGRTIEARGSKYGVGSFEASSSRFNYAAVIPQLSGPGTGMGAGAGLSTVLPDFGPAIDSDADGLIDGREVAMGSNPRATDSDGDGMSDGYEVARLHTDAAKADTDGDGLGDAFELAKGFDPTDPDSDRDGRLDGVDGPQADSDRDAISDSLERLLGSDARSADSDRDGFTDGLEYQSGFDPTDPLANPMTGQGGLGDPLTGPLTGLPGGSGPPSQTLTTGLSGGGRSAMGDATSALDDLGAS
jgi:cell wall-associated NlpC family hydrolase